MKYYQRKVIIRDYQGKYRKAVFVPEYQYIKTNNIDKFNKGLRIRFEESKDARKYLLHRQQDVVYRETEELSNSEIYFRKSISRSR